MRAGIKLDIRFDEHPDYRRLFGESDVCAFLRARGVQAVESPVEPDTDAAHVAVHIRRCADAGLRLSLHPYTEGTQFNPGLFHDHPDNPCRRMHERFLGWAANAAAIQKCRTVVNIHSAAGGADARRDDLMERSIEFFRWAADWCARNAPAVRVGAELQIRDASGVMQRIGAEYGELLRVASGAEIGICWDLGHAFMNARRFGWPLEPPPAFLLRVVHVHCHDVNEEDHEPLIHNNVPWRRQLADLADAGFDGTVILEVTPKRFIPSGGLPALEQSLTALQHWQGD